MTYRHLVPEIACQKYEPRVFGFKVCDFVYDNPTAIIILFRYDNSENGLIPSNVCKHKVCTVETTSLDGPG